MSTKGRLWLGMVLWAVLLGDGWNARGQAVAVTLRLDTNTIAVGASTVLRVSAQVLPAFRPGADRIFSWYVDVLNSDGAAVEANYTAMLKAASDRDPLISSSGFSSGANRFGVYDTFLNLPGAGTASPVELMAIPVRGLAAGTARFSVRAGTGVPQLSEDFIVASTNGVDLWTGGNYQLAAADLNVAEGCGNVRLQMQPATGTTWRLFFTPCPGQNHTVEFRNTLETGSWQALPGAPHNSGSLTVTNITSRRFFRVRTEAP